MDRLHGGVGRQKAELLVVDAPQEQSSGVSITRSQFDTSADRGALAHLAAQIGVDVADLQVRQGPRLVEQPCNSSTKRVTLRATLRDQVERPSPTADSRNVRYTSRSMSDAAGCALRCGLPSSSANCVDPPQVRIEATPSPTVSQFAGLRRPCYRPAASYRATKAAGACTS